MCVYITYEFIIEMYLHRYNVFVELKSFQDMRVHESRIAHLLITTIQMKEEDADNSSDQGAPLFP